MLVYTDEMLTRCKLKGELLMHETFAQICMGCTLHINSLGLGYSGQKHQSSRASPSLD